MWIFWEIQASWSSVLHISRNTVEMHLSCQMSFMWLFLDLSETKVS